MHQRMSNPDSRECSRATTTKSTDHNREDDNLDHSSHSVDGGKRILPDGFQPGPLDIICARGKLAFNWAGNVHFRKKLIEENLEKYSLADTKLEKTKIVTSIINEVRRTSPNGGFVKHDGHRWYEIGLHAAREKVGQSFRDLLHTKYKSSTKAKKRRRKALEQDARLKASDGDDDDEEDDRPAVNDILVHPNVSERVVKKRASSASKAAVAQSSSGLAVPGLASAESSNLFMQSDPTHVTGLVTLQWKGTAGRHVADSAAAMSVRGYPRQLQPSSLSYNLDSAVAALNQHALAAPIPQRSVSEPLRLPVSDLAISTPSGPNRSLSSPAGNMSNQLALIQPQAIAHQSSLEPIPLGQAPFNQPNSSLSFQQGGIISYGRQDSYKQDQDCTIQIGRSAGLAAQAGQHHELLHEQLELPISSNFLSATGQILPGPEVGSNAIYSQARGDASLQPLPMQSLDEAEGSVLVDQVNATDAPLPTGEDLSLVFSESKDL